MGRLAHRLREVPRGLRHLGPQKGVPLDYPVGRGARLCHAGVFRVLLWQVGIIADARRSISGRYVLLVSHTDSNHRWWRPHLGGTGGQASPTT